MIWFNITLQNPWYRRDVRFDTLLLRHWRLSLHKHLEIQVMRNSMYNLFVIELDTRWIGTDHGGLALELELLSYAIKIQLYDSRHWDHAHGCWSDGHDTE